jgi:hypothetical protein
LLVRRYGPPLPALLRRIAPVAAVVVVALAAFGTATGDGPDDDRRDEAAREPINAVADEMVRLARGHDRVTVLLDGPTATSAVGPAAVLQLVAAGHDVRVPYEEDRFWGENREFDPDDDPGLVLQLTTRRGPVRDMPGRVALRYSFNPEINAVLPGLVAQIEAGPATLADDSDDLLRDLPKDERPLLQAVLDDMQDKPYEALLNPTVVELLLSGAVTEPTLDREALEVLRDNLPLVLFNADDTFEVQELTADELRNARPDLFR